MIYLNKNKIFNGITNVLKKQNLENESITSLANSLVQTSLRGVDSHGINLFPHYYAELLLNKINKNPKFVFEQSSSTTCILDANNSFGHRAGDVAIDKLLEMCKETGISCISVKNSNHFGAAAYFTNRLANNGMIGFAFTNSEAFINAHNTNELFLGTNPFCFSAPMYDEEPFCLDMATSNISWNKVKNYKRWNKLLQSGVALDSNGKNTIDPHKATSLTPIGGYKGFGLGMVIEILCAGLTLSPISKDIRPLYDLTVDGDRNISHFFMAIDISKFGSVENISKYIKNICDRVRNFESIDNNEPSMVAGDKEKIFYNNRLKTGIPIDEEKFKEFCNIDLLFEKTTQ